MTSICEFHLLNPKSIGPSWDWIRKCSGKAGIFVALAHALTNTTLVQASSAEASELDVGRVAASESPWVNEEHGVLLDKLIEASRGLKNSKLSNACLTSACNRLTQPDAIGVFGYWKFPSMVKNPCGLSLLAVEGVAKNLQPNLDHMDAFEGWTCLGLKYLSVDYLCSTFIGAYGAKRVPGRLPHESLEVHISQSGSAVNALCYGLSAAPELTVFGSCVSIETPSFLVQALVPIHSPKIESGSNELNVASATQVESMRDRLRLVLGLNWFGFRHFNGIKWRVLGKVEPLVSLPQQLFKSDFSEIFRKSRPSIAIQSALFSGAVLLSFEIKKLESNEQRWWWSNWYEGTTLKLSYNLPVNRPTLISKRWDSRTADRAMNHTLTPNLSALIL